MISSYKTERWITSTTHYTPFMFVEYQILWIRLMNVSLRLGEVYRSSNSIPALEGVAEDRPAMSPAREAAPERCVIRAYAATPGDHATQGRLGGLDG